MMSQNKGSKVNLSAFRRAVVKRILEIQPNMTGISRRELFIAITLFDKAYIKLLSQPALSQLKDQNLVLPFAIACLKLACKFQNQFNPKICNLAKFFKYESDLDNLKLLTSRAELEILQLIDYQIPTETFFTTLQSLNWQNSLTTKQVCFFLKLFQIGLQFSTELTQNLTYGSRIYQNIRMRCQRDQKISNYIETIKNWVKEQNNKQKIQV